MMCVYIHKCAYYPLIFPAQLYELEYTGILGCTGWGWGNSPQCTTKKKKKKKEYKDTPIKHREPHIMITHTSHPL